MQPLRDPLDQDRLIDFQPEKGIPPYSMRRTRYVGDGQKRTKVRYELVFNMDTLVWWLGRAIAPEPGDILPVEQWYQLARLYATTEEFMMPFIPGGAGGERFSYRHLDEILSWCLFYTVTRRHKESPEEYASRLLVFLRDRVAQEERFWTVFCQQRILPHLPERESRGLACLLGFIEGLPEQERTWRYNALKQSLAQCSERSICNVLLQNVLDSPAITATYAQHFNTFRPLWKVLVGLLLRLSPRTWLVEEGGFYSFYMSMARKNYQAEDIVKFFGQSRSILKEAKNVFHIVENLFYQHVYEETVRSIVVEGAEPEDFDPTLLATHLHIIKTLSTADNDIVADWHNAVPNDEKGARFLVDYLAVCVISHMRWPTELMNLDAAGQERFFYPWSNAIAKDILYCLDELEARNVTELTKKSSFLALVREEFEAGMMSLLNYMMLYHDDEDEENDFLDRLFNYLFRNM